MCEEAPARGSPRLQPRSTSAKPRSLADSPPQRAAGVLLPLPERNSEIKIFATKVDGFRRKSVDWRFLLLPVGLRFGSPSLHHGAVYGIGCQTVEEMPADHAGTTAIQLGPTSAIAEVGPSGIEGDQYADGHSVIMGLHIQVSCRPRTRFWETPQPKVTPQPNKSCSS